MKKSLIVLVLFLLSGVCAARTHPVDPNYVGFVDRVDCNRMAGWAADRNRPNVPINVSIYVDGNASPLMTVLANTQREPAVGQFVGSGDNGQHGFDFGQPLRDGQPHTFTLKFESSSALVNAGGGPNPASLTCGASQVIAIPNPKITVFEISSRKGVGVGPKAAELAGNVNTTSNPNLYVHVEFDQPERIQFYRLGEIPCPESVSDHPEDRMRSLPWKPYSQGQVFTFDLNTNLAQPYGTRCVFMQVNTTQSESSASPAKGDAIVLAPAHLKSFALTGATLAAFLDRAKAAGYKFIVTRHDFPVNDCPIGSVAQPDFHAIRISPVGAGFVETITAKLFDRGDPFLNVFWRVMDIRVGRDPAVVTIVGPQSGRPDDPTRTVTVRQGWSEVACAPPPQTNALDTSTLTSITLEGPDDKQPADAFFDPNHANQFPRIILRPNFKLRP